MNTKHQSEHLKNVLTTFRFLGRLPMLLRRWAPSTIRGEKWNQEDYYCRTCYQPDAGDNRHCNKVARLELQSRQMMLIGPYVSSRRRATLLQQIRPVVWGLVIRWESNTARNRCWAGLHSPVIKQKWKTGGNRYQPVSHSLIISLAFR